MYMNYDTNYKIKDVTVLGTVDDFQNLIHKIEIICEISINELNEIIQLPLVSLLPIPQDTENYIPFEDITKETLIEWVLRDNQYKIDMVVNRMLQINKTKQPSDTNKQQKLTIKTFTENQSGNLEFINEKTFSEQISEEIAE